MDYARLAELERLMDQVSQHSARALRTSGDSQLNVISDVQLEEDKVLIFVLVPLVFVP